MQSFISYKTEISQFLSDFFASKQQELNNSYFPEDVFERLMPLVTSGKMLRGSLLINTYEKLSGQNFSPAVLKAAVSLELAGTAFLIHDDIIDQDELRRGQITFHHQYAKRAQNKKYQQPDHVGASLAICVGDLVFFLAFELLSDNLSKLFARQFSITTFGEMHDVELALMRGEDATQEDIVQMYLDKTSSYSVCLPLMAGAVLANQSQKIILQLNELGKTLGLIFQIKDDELGLFGDMKKTGKPIGADIREGKKTLYYYYLLQKVDEDEKEKVLDAFGNQSLDEGCAEEMLGLMKNHQIRELVNEDIKKLETKTQQQIKKLSTLMELKEMLVEFLEMSLKRKK